MSNDKTTLADAQPGGRVRLGDQDEKPPQELPALIVTRGDGIPLPDQAAAIEEFKRQCLRRVGAEYPHLSAQPSPGAQAAHCPVKHCGMTYARVPADGRCHACGASVQPSPGGQGDAVRALPAEWRERADELSVHDAIGLTHQLKLRDCADELEVAISSEKERS